MSRTKSININLNTLGTQPNTCQSNLWLLGLLLLFLFWSVGFYLYQYQLRERMQITNLFLNKEFDGQNQLIAQSRTIQNSDQVISRHERIQHLISTIEPQADKFAEIDKVVIPGVLVESIDISGKQIIISGRCGDYDQMAMMIKNIDQGGAMAIVKSECTQSLSDIEINFVVEADWIKI